MNCTPKAVLPILCLALAACGQAKGAADAVEAEIFNPAGVVLGTARFEPATHGVIITISAQYLEPGKHGMHLHQVGNCNDPNAGFTASGGHIAPSGKPHGFRNEKGPHEGDLPNLVVGEDGTARVELYTDMVTMKEGVAALRDADGSALVIHEKPDDYNSQPIGGAGARVGCAAIPAAKK